MFVRDVRLQIAITLFTITLISLFRFFSLSIFFILLLSLAASQLTDALFTLFYKKKPFFSYSAVVTSLLIFLLIDKTSPLWAFIVTPVIAITSKNILKFGQKHIFNPAAFGSLVTSFFIPGSLTWWGVAWSPLVSIIIIVGSFMTLKKLRRLYIVGGFLLIYLLYYLLTSHSILAFKALIDGTVILFAFIMLPEPQSTPVVGIWQKIFGLVVGIIMVALLTLVPTFRYDPLIFSLLIVDLTSFIIIHKLNKTAF